MKLFRKAINFDLDTKEMAKYMENISQGYYNLEKSLKKFGFEHRQGSGYISNQKLDNIDLAKKLKQVVQENTWLTKCVKAIDVTNIDKNFEYIDYIKNIEVPELKTLDELNNNNSETTTRSPELQEFIAMSSASYSNFGMQKQEMNDNIED